MTQKELLYLEDAINHEKNIISICNEAINMLENDDLISFFENEKNKHQELFDSLINSMEVMVNE